MRLLILHLATVFGGAERTTKNLLDHLDRATVQHVTLASPIQLRDLLPPRFDEFVDTSPHISRGWFSSPGDLLADAWATGRLLVAAKPDVVLGMMHYSAALAVLGAKRSNAGIAAVGSFRGPAFEYMRRYEKGRARNAFLRGAIGLTARLADRMIVPSEGTAAELRDRFFGSRKRTVVIPNGIDLEAVTLASAEMPEGLERLPRDRPLLCVAARLSPEKDLDLLFHAFRSLQDRRPCALAVVGDGSERTRLESLVASWSLQDRVTFLGHRENVYPYMKVADLYVHTCQFEGFGYTMLEAMACGTPVIATDCPYGPREVIGRDRYGLLVPPGDVGALADGIVGLLSQPNRLAELRRLGLVRAEQLSIERMARAYESVFTELLH